MALIFMDGFDYYTAAQAGRRWAFVGPGGQTCAGRFNGQGWLWTGITSPTAMFTTFANTATLTVGMAFSFDSFSGSESLVNPFLIFQDAGGNTQVDVRVGTDNTNGYFQIRNGSGTVLATPNFNTFSFGYWNYLEFQVTCDQSAGVIELRLNGTTAVRTTGINTRPHTATLISRMVLQPIDFAGAAINEKFDDLYLCDSTGTFDNTFLGECRVQTNYPFADGNEVDFVPKTGILHYAMVNEPQSDDDISYDAGSGIGQRELFQITPFSFNGTIFGVQVNVTQRKDDVGNRTIAVENRQGIVDYEGAPVMSLSQYAISSQIWQVNPNGGATWTLSTLNAAQFGIVIKS